MEPVKIERSYEEEEGGRGIAEEGKEEKSHRKEILCQNMMFSLSLTESVVLLKYRFSLPKFAYHLKFLRIISYKRNM
jgi:hypothetical protein